jgi:transposase-like protein
VGTLRAVKTLDEWAEVIKGDLTRSLSGLIAAGQHLQAAKGEHPQHFVEWVQSGAVGLSIDSAQRLMKIATNLAAVDTADLRHRLPSGVTVLGELARLEPPELASAIQADEVHPDMTIREATAVVANYHQPKYNPDVKAEVIERAIGGESHTALAGEFGIPRVTITTWTRKAKATAPAAPSPGRKQRNETKRVLTNTAIALDGLVSTLRFIDTRAVQLDPDLWQWVEAMKQSLVTLTNFAKELSHAATPAP